MPDGNSAALSIELNRQDDAEKFRPVGDAAAEWKAAWVTAFLRKLPRHSACDVVSESLDTIDFDFGTLILKAADHDADGIGELLIAAIFKYYERDAQEAFDEHVFTEDDQ
jgi:hypothetical protein